MNKIIYILFCLIFLQNKCFGQYNEEYTIDGYTGAAWHNTSVDDLWYINLQKYWYYRYRLVNDFMLIGNKAGESLPASCRNRGDDNADWGDLDNSYGSDHNCRNLLDWGTDATNSLGHYLTMLAIEYRQLRGYGYSTARTLYEINYAMSAFNRLCAYAGPLEYSSLVGGLSSYPGEVIIPYSLPEHGFFLRDDVPYLTITDPVTHSANYQHFNRPGLQRADNMFIVNKGSGAFRTTYDGPNPGSIGPSHISASYAVPGYPVAESQDQLNEVFIGYALLCKYLDGLETDIPMLRNAAQNTLYKIIDWPRHYTGSYPWYYWFFTSMSSYFSIPDVLDPSKCAGWNCTDAGIFLFEAVGATDACYKILSTTGADITLRNLALHNKTLTSFPDHSLVLSYESIQDLWVGCGATTDDIYDDAYACFANDWSTYVPSLGILSYLNYESYMTQFNHNWCTWHAIKRRAAQDFFGTPQYPLLYELMQGDKGYEHHDLISSILDAAPCCGPWNNENASAVAGTAGDFENVTGNAYPDKIYVTFGDAISEWSGNDLIGDPTHRRDPSCYGNNASYASEFNGVDYMELFNLFSYEREMAHEQNSSNPSYLQGMFNPYYMEYFNRDYPDNLNYGSNEHRLTLNWLEYLSAKDHIHADGNGWVQFRGAKVIDLIPDPFDALGFEAEYGSYFDASIKDYNCHGHENNNNPYSFATVYEEGGGKIDSSHHSISTYKELPIEYLPYGKRDFKKEKDLPVTNRYDIVIDSLLNIPEIRNQILTTLKSKIINTYSNDTGVMNFLKNRYYWTDDTISKYKILVQDELSVNIMPNPTDGKSFVTYNMSKDNWVHISISNSIGQKFDEIIEEYYPEQTAGQHQVQINSEQLVPGFYIVAVQIGGQLVSKKLVKM